MTASWSPRGDQAAGVTVSSAPWGSCPRWPSSRVTSWPGSATFVPSGERSVCSPAAPMPTSEINR
ncbi:hypothetical protein WEI85_17720 [Actinomycetes bacterium KLBMP 9797]